MAASLVTMFFLSACMSESGIGGLGLLESESDKATAIHELPLYGGDVVVRAPNGYCVDMAHVTRRPAATVAPLASCSSLTGEGFSPVEPAFMTVSVLSKRTRAEQPRAADLAATFAPAEVTAVEDGDGVALVRVSDGGQSRLPEGDPRHWRGAMEINGHLVGLALYAPSGSDLTGAAGRRLVLALAESLREASMKESLSQVSSRSGVE
jgi:hypothetical protein